MQNMTPYSNLPITDILPLVHLITPAPHTPPIKQAQSMHQNTRSRYTRPEKRTRQIPVQHHDTPICTRHSHTHEVPSRFTTHYPTKKTLQLMSAFSPLVTAQHTTCSNTRLVLLKMGIMMPEICWESIDDKHLTVASCWFSLALYNVGNVSTG